MAGCQDVLTDTFMSLIAQKASAEVILEVLVAEAALLFPSLTRPDLEIIVMGVLEDDSAVEAGAPEPTSSAFRIASRPSQWLNDRLAAQRSWL